MKVNGTTSHNYCPQTVHTLLLAAEKPDSDLTRKDLLRILESANQVVIQYQDRIRMLSNNLQIITNQLNEN